MSCVSVLASIVILVTIFIIFYLSRSKLSVLNLLKVKVAVYDDRGELVDLRYATRNIARHLYRLFPHGGLTAASYQN